MRARDIDETDQIAKLLAGFKPFSALPSPERSLIAAGLRLRRFARGENVFCEGQSAEEGWLVHSGAVRILTYYGDARLMQIERLTRGQVFGLYCRLGGNSRTHQCTAVADDSLIAVRLADELWRRCLASFPEFSQEACLACAVRLLHMRRLATTNKDSVERRVARAILRLSRTQGERVAATRQSLAVETGTALETVFRVLARFRRRGWIVTGRSSILIKDAAALSAVLERQAPARRRPSL
jgi:CRP-like cAMP-binding protein